MRLAAKPFLISLIVIVVLAAVGFLSFYAVGNLVSVNREIATRTVPAMRLAASTRESIAPLVRLETRAAVLGDSRYVAAWTERTERVADDLQRLAQYVQSEPEAMRLGAAREAFEKYRTSVTAELSLLRGRDRESTLRLSNTTARALAEEVEENLDALMEAIHTRMLSAQAEAGRLEARTWTGVLIALSAAVGLALLVAPQTPRLPPQAPPHITPPLHNPPPPPI